MVAGRRGPQPYAPSRRAALRLERSPRRRTSAHSRHADSPPRARDRLRATRPRHAPPRESIRLWDLLAGGDPDAAASLPLHTPVASGLPTRLFHELGAEEYAEALAEHRRAIRAACAAEGGVEVDTQGDAFFFAFPTASGALAAAETMTASLASGPIQVRVGLHTGTPLLTEEGYVGEDVHFAARVGASGHGGQVILSDATAKLVDLSLSDLGEHRLKDIEQAVPIFQLGETSFPPLKTISNTNLPRPASSFVGRVRRVARSGRMRTTARPPRGDGAATREHPSEAARPE